MPDTSTEVALATTTLSSDASEIIFSSISSAYTDLRIVLVGKSSVNYVKPRIQFNSNTSNYSQTLLYGNGSSAASERETNQAAILCGAPNGMRTSENTFFTIDIFSYNSSVNKTVLVTNNEEQSLVPSVGVLVGRWGNTSAITSVRLFASGANFSSGTIATIYGIL